MVSILYERYTTGDDKGPGLYGVWWWAQIFTVGNTGTNENHTVTSVKLKVFREGSPGTGTVAIYATSGGLPAGSALCSVDYNFNNLGVYPGDWVEFTFTSPATLSASTQYAIVVRAPDGNPIPNLVRWRADSSSPTYTGGYSVRSPDSGSSWTLFTGYDFMFKEYGEVQCSDYTSQVTCEAAGCYWWNGSCHDNPPTCSQLNNEPDCDIYGCYWYDGACHSTPAQPEICDWIDSKGGHTALTTTQVVEIINSYIYGTPPSGYTFIPTIIQASGVVDYYLGFDGDAATGCDFFP